MRATPDRLKLFHVKSEAERAKSLRVLARTFEEEKGWVRDPAQVFPAEDLDRDAIAWFLAEEDGIPVGVTRVLFEIPFELYNAYQFELATEGLDVDEFVRTNRIAEVGRFAVVPEKRRNLLVAASLMRAAATETVRRGFSHFITDVFENEASSPYEFHRRILGFEVVATHETGELLFKGRRITMLLDLKSAYQRLREKRGWVFRYITSGWSDDLVHRLTAQ